MRNLVKATGVAFAMVLGLAVSGNALAATSHSWEQNAYTVHLLNQSYPVIASYFFNRAGSYGTGSSLTSDPVQDGFAATPVLRYTSYAQFASDISGGKLPNPIWPAGSVVEYDNEDWASTPQNEINDPWTYMKNFASLAHAHGFLAEVTPARDLGNDTSSVCPKKSGETLDQWYIRCDIPGSAGMADIYVVQTQVDTTSPSAYLNLFNQAYDRAKQVNPNCKVFAELSVNYGTPSQAYSATTQPGIRPWDGIFYSGANDSASLKHERDTLLLFKQNGY